MGLTLSTHLYIHIYSNSTRSSQATSFPSTVVAQCCLRLVAQLVAAFVIPSSFISLFTKFYYKQEVFRIGVLQKVKVCCEFRGLQVLANYKTCPGCASCGETLVGLRKQEHNLSNRRLFDCSSTML